MTALSIAFPDRLRQKLDSFVADGWAASADDIVVEALRRFLDSHAPSLVESQVMSDVEWGLRGDV
jgi:Arc/MetJ-type ribon-helix-helix transcriptional regulator